ncbi:MAG: glycosyl transferase [Epsilonproteobacteria bacterium]|nr:glycosyl transferase [Campylobacterota bacterium]
MSDFLKYIKAVGTGPRHNRDLSKDEAYDAMNQILGGQVSNEVIGAFLLGWRVKSETSEEFTGAVEAFDTFTTKCEIPNSIELGYPYDGKNDNPYLFTLVASYLENFGINLVLCGDDLNHAKGGFTVKQICQNTKLGANIFYFNRNNVFPALSKLNPIRENLQIRTSLNSIEKLTGFASSKVGILGAFHKPFVDKYIQIYKNRYKKFAVIKGNEGSLEIFGKCKLWICEGENIEEITINPEEFGVTYQKSWDKISMEESLEMIQNPSEELLKLAKLNAAVMLYIYGDNFKSIEEAFEAITL